MKKEELRELLSETLYSDKAKIREQQTVNLLHQVLSYINNKHKDKGIKCGFDEDTYLITVEGGSEEDRMEVLEELKDLGCF